MNPELTEKWVSLKERTGLYIGISYLGFSVRKKPDDKEWEHDLWKVTLRRNEESFSIKYRTGLGHRKLSKSDAQRCAEQKLKKGSIGYDNFVNAHAKPVCPRDWEVMGCIVSDFNAAACSTDFDDFCANFGLNNDSIKELEGYMEIKRIHKSMDSMFSDKLLDELKEMFLDT